MLLISENIIQIIFLIRELVSWRRAHARIFQTHTSPEHGMSQSVTNAGESQWAFDYSAVKPVVWSGNIWIRKERVVSQRGLYFLRSLDSLLGMELKIAE